MEVSSYIHVHFIFIFMSFGAVLVTYL